MVSGLAGTDGERKDMDNERQENNENSGGGQLRQSLLSSRWFRVLGASALLVGFAAGGFGIASATTNSGGSSTAGATGTGPGWGYQTGHRPGPRHRLLWSGRLSQSGLGGQRDRHFTVKGHDGTTVTVDVTSSTTYKDQEGHLAELRQRHHR